MTISAVRASVGLAAVALLALSSCSTDVSDDVGAVGAASSTPTAATSAAATRSPSATAKAKAADTSCTSNYHAGGYSFDVIMQNNTGQTLTLDPDLTGRGEGHWAARPPSTLGPGECAVINAYSDDPPGGFYLTATYLMPDGTFIPFACGDAEAYALEVSCNTSALSKMPDSDFSTLAFDGTIDNAWQINTASTSGSVHFHFTLVAEPKP